MNIPKPLPAMRGARALAVCSFAATAGPMKVCVTGAGGRTGSLVMKKLQERPEFTARGVVRSEKSGRSLKQYGVSEEDLVVGDLLAGGAGLLAEALEGCDALVIATSAVPKINPFSLVKVMLAKVTGQQGVRPSFTFKADQAPEQIDWEGQKMQIDAAKRCGVKKVVLIGSMGGTDRGNFLNTIGGGNILVWKRRAEKYLIDSGLEYTIVHPGGLTDEKDGERELVLNVDDKLISEGGKYRRIPRGDVAELSVQCLLLAEARNRAIDVVAKEPADAPPTRDWAALLRGMPANCCYADMKDDAVLAAAR